MICERCIAHTHTGKTFYELRYLHAYFSKLGLAVTRYNWYKLYLEKVKEESDTAEFITDATILAEARHNL